MSFSDDVRNHFEGEARRHPTPAGLRATVVAEASAASPAERRTARWAALVAVLLAVAIVLGLVAANGLRKSVATPVGHNPSPLVRTPGQLPPGDLLDATMRDSDSGWVLLERCSASSCKFFVSVNDGSGTWQGPVQVGPEYPSTGGDAPRHVQIVSADGMNGLVYGHSEAFVTHDGGQTWKDAGLGAGEVVAITGHGTAWAVTRPCAKGVQCAYQVQLSRDGARTWISTAPLPDGFAPESVASFAKGGLLVSTFGTGELLLTQDGGLTWTPIAGHCRPETTMSAVATPDGNQLWQLCVPPQPPVVTTGVWLATLYVSDDGGSSWTTHSTPGASTVHICSTTPHAAIVATNTAGIEVTLNDGYNSSQITTDPQYFSFVSLSCLADGSAWAVDSRAEIWATTDGGRSWRKLAVGFATG